MLGTWDRDNAFPRQILPKTKRTEDIYYHGQFAHKPTRTKKNLIQDSYPG